ncbi:MAG: histone deacetylase family protein [Desulfobacterales bacterium]|jgi:acetoin utilization deacetylase AcuC-like enzyme
MKVFFHHAFYELYTSDPAAAGGRMEAIVEAIEGQVTLVEPRPATEAELSAVRDRDHIAEVRRMGLCEIAALAAGGAIEAADAGLTSPSFALIRPPGHHASIQDAWGFCYFNNMAVALMALKQRGKIEQAFVLDIDLHYGDGTVNILGSEDWVEIFNPAAADRKGYLTSVQDALHEFQGDVIGVSAGFDYHVQDWGGLLTTEDYRRVGAMVRTSAASHGAGCFGVLEGGYNHRVLGSNVLAFIEGLEGRTR